MSLREELNETIMASQIMAGAAISVDLEKLKLAINMSDSTLGCELAKALIPNIGDNYENYEKAMTAMKITLFFATEMQTIYPELVKQYQPKKG